MQSIVILLLGAVCFSTFGVLIRALEPYFGPLMQTGLRFVAAALVLLLAGLPKKSRRAAHGIWSPAGIAFMICFPIMVVTFTYSALHIKAANALFLLYASNLLFSLLAGRMVYGEAMHARQIVASGLALVGVGCMADFSNPLTWSLGTLMGLLSGVFEGGSNLLRRQLQHTDSRKLLLTQFVVGALCLIPVGWFWDATPVHSWNPAALVPLAAFGAVLALGNLCFNYGFARVPLAKATVIVSSELILALIINAKWLGETPTGPEIIGVAAIGIAVLLSIRAH